MDEQLVIELYAKYDCCKKVADELGTYSEAIRRVLIKNGVNRTGNRKRNVKRSRPSNCSTVYCGALVVMLRANLDVTTSDIVAFTGIPTNSVVNITNRKCPTLKKARCQRIPDSIIESIERDYVAGTSTYEIGDKYSIHHSTVSSLMIKRGHYRGKGKGPAAERINRARQEEADKKIIAEFGECSYSTKKDREYRRRYRIANRKRDVGITWKSLAERNGSLVCEVCGIECNPLDKTWGSFGPTHPSVDHVIRICDGGEDTWDNSRLACMKCNLELNKKASREVKAYAKEQAIADERP